MSAVDSVETILEDIKMRRKEQDEKWGELPRRHHPGTWAMILGEEYGEACQAVIEGKSVAEVYDELLDLAAVAASWMQELLILQEIGDV